MRFMPHCNMSRGVMPGQMMVMNRGDVLRAAALVSAARSAGAAEQFDLAAEKERGRVLKAADQYLSEQPVTDSRRRVRLRSAGGAA